MSHKYSIIITKNRKKHKNVLDINSEFKAKKFYEEELVKSEKVVLPKILTNYEPSFYEIILLTKDTYKHKHKLLTHDYDGNKIERSKESEYGILRIEPYYIEEKFRLWNNQRKYDINQIIDEFIAKDKLNTIYKLKNKIIIENEILNKPQIFIAQTEFDAARLYQKIDSLIKNNAVFIGNIASINKSTFYEYLMESTGISKKLLYYNNTKQRFTA